MSPMLQKTAFRRVLALAILAVMLNGIHLLAVSPYLDALERNRDAAEQLDAALTRYRRSGAQLPALQARLETRQQNGAAQSGYLDGQNETLAAAMLQDRLKMLVAREGGHLASTQVLAGKDDGRARRVAIRGQMTIRIGELQRVLYEIEAGAPFLFIDNLDIRTVSAARETGDEGERLDVGFDVYGYLWRTS